MPNLTAYHEILTKVNKQTATLVAVSKRKSIAEIQALYDAGHRDFGENYVQELVEKSVELPTDIRWHYIGTLQRNKVKYLVPFVHMIHGVDSLKLANEINKRAQHAGRIINVLLQVDVTDEETKHGFVPDQLVELFEDLAFHRLAWIRPSGIMGMATNTRREERVSADFQQLRGLYEKIGSDYYDRRPEWNTLSMGMSGDYELALASGSNLLRVGSLIFGARK